MMGFTSWQAAWQRALVLGLGLVALPVLAQTRVNINPGDRIETDRVGVFNVWKGALETSLRKAGASAVQTRYSSDATADMNAGRANVYDLMVGPAPGQSAGDSWCAAGDFVISRGMPTNTRIWRLSEPPRRQAEGVRFGLSPEGAASKIGLIVLGGRDASLSAIHAIQFCIRDYKEVED